MSTSENWQTSKEAKSLQYSLKNMVRSCHRLPHQTSGFLNQGSAATLFAGASEEIWTKKTEMSCSLSLIREWQPRNQICHSGPVFLRTCGGVEKCDPACSSSQVIYRDADADTYAVIYQIWKGKKKLINTQKKKGHKPTCKNISRETNKL